MPEAEKIALLAMSLLIRMKCQSFSDEGMISLTDKGRELFAQIWGVERMDGLSADTPDAALFSMVFLGTYAALPLETLDLLYGNAYMMNGRIDERLNRPATKNGE